MSRLLQNYGTNMCLLKHWLKHKRLYILSIMSCLKISIYFILCTIIFITIFPTPLMNRARQLFTYSFTIVLCKLYLKNMSCKFLNPQDFLSDLQSAFNIRIASTLIIQHLSSSFHLRSTALLLLRRHLQTS